MPEALKRAGRLRAFHSEAAAERVGMWAKATILGDGVAEQWCRTNGVALHRAANEGQNTAGGFLAPIELEAAVASLREKYGVFRRFARHVSMTSDTKNQPRRIGGATVYFVSEAASIAESQLTYDAIGLSVEKIAALIKISSELAEDSAVDVAEDIAADLAEGFAQKEDECGWNGDGTSTFGGMAGITKKLVDGSHDAGKVVAATGHDTFAELDVVDLTNLMGKLPTRALPGAAWWTSQLGNALSICRLAASAGGIAVVNGEATFLGFPVRVSAALPQLSTSLSGSVMIAFGDLRLAAAFGDRRGLTVAKSELGSTFTSDQITVRGTERFDIVNHDLGDAQTPGAIVGLVGA